MERTSPSPRVSAWRVYGARIRRWAMLLGVFYALMLVALSLFENRLVFFPSAFPAGDWQPRNLTFEDAAFQAADGTQLHGWYVPHPEPREVVLFAHGNGGNLTAWTDDLRDLHALGVSAMIFDYRGYGKSQGEPDEQGVLQDARAARAWLAERSGVAEPEIVLMGVSLGSAVMVDLAAKEGARGLILQNAFTSLPDVASSHYRWVPTGWLMRNRLEAARIIGDYRGPLFASHAGEDAVVPLSLGKRLFAAANEPKQFFEIRGADHNDAIPAAYYRRLDGFLNDLPQKGQPVLSRLENALVFFPRAFPEGDWQPQNLEFEDAEFQAADGTRLHGWYVPHAECREAILFAHGNGGNLTWWADDLRDLHALGVSAMIFDYRGYGKSQGAPDERGILQDARAARAWLARRSGLPEAEIVLMGVSLGCAVMVDLAAKDGARGLILQNAFTSLPEVARHHYPWVPASWLMRNRLESARMIGGYRGPLFASHAGADTVVPLSLGKRLFAAANEPKQFYEIPGADHNDPAGEEYYRRLDDFLDDLPERPPSSRLGRR